MYLSCDTNGKSDKSRSGICNVQIDRQSSTRRENKIEAATYQYFKNTIRSLSLDADAVDLANFVADVNEAGSIGRTAMHYSRYHDLAGDLACFYGRPLLSTCKLIF